MRLNGGGNRCLVLATKHKYLVCEAFLFVPWQRIKGSCQGNDSTLADMVSKTFKSKLTQLKAFPSISRRELEFPNCCVVILPCVKCVSGQ